MSVASPRRVAGRARRWLVALTASAVAAGAEPADRYHWKAASKEGGCDIVTSDVAGKRYIAAKATCVLSSPISQVREVLRDIAQFPSWMADCRETKVLRVVDQEKEEYVFWFRQHIPVFADRDMVLKTHVTHSEVEGREVSSIVASSTDEVKFDAGKGYVRMPFFTSEWRLEVLDAQRTQVSFMIDPDLGGGMPAAFASPEIAETPLQSIQGLVKKLKARPPAPPPPPPSPSADAGTP